MQISAFSNFHLMFSNGKAEIKINIIYLMGEIIHLVINTFNRFFNTGALSNTRKITYFYVDCPAANSLFLTMKKQSKVYIIFIFYTYPAYRYQNKNCILLPKQ